MKVKFLKKYKHTIKTFQEGDIVQVHTGFGELLLKKKVVTLNLEETSDGRDSRSDSGD